MADDPTRSSRLRRRRRGPSAAVEAPKKPVDPDFEPEIIVFACHYCAYAAADLAGSMRLQYPSNIRMIKLPCTGKLEVIHLLRALEAGADGVYAAGCLEGECHYLKGNLWARKRIEPTSRSSSPRSASSPSAWRCTTCRRRWAPSSPSVATEFTDRIKRLGPNPLRRHGVSPHAAAREAASDVAMPDEAPAVAAAPGSPDATTEKGPAE